MRSIIGIETIVKKLQSELAEELDSCGLMYRIFSRVKSEESILRKIETKNYRNEGKKITDIIGIRITLYFQDDVDIVYNMLKGKKNFDHESTDPIGTEDFKPLRCNLTFNLEGSFKSEAEKVISDNLDVIDTKYEVQIRTVLSEGWHEVEHDLRYKCKDDWADHDDLNRNLNGILATLETSEFSMLQMFNSLAYRHYKNKNVNGMLKALVRIRFKSSSLSNDLEQMLLNDPEVTKKIIRLNRKVLLALLHKSRISLPLTMDNMLFIANHLLLKDEKLSEMANEFVRSELELSAV